MLDLIEAGVPQLTRNLAVNLRGRVIQRQVGQSLIKRPSLDRTRQTEVGDRIRERGQEYGTTTNRPRRCGWLDLVAVRYSAMISGATKLAVMLCNGCT